MLRQCRIFHCHLYFVFAEICLESTFYRHEVAKPKPGVDVIISPGGNPEPFTFRFWPPRLKEDVDEMIGEQLTV
jgi:hypothetical protein